MARKNNYGKYILSAGEIGTYTVCPEAWRLQSIRKVKPTYSASVAKGDRLHREWSADLDEAMYFTRSIRFIVLLVILSVTFFLLRFALV